MKVNPGREMLVQNGKKTQKVKKFSITFTPPGCQDWKSLDASLSDIMGVVGLKRDCKQGVEWGVKGSSGAGLFMAL